jgi:hypothetical protein
VNALIKEKMRTTVSEITLPVGISYGSAFVIVQVDLGYHKICARYVTRQLTEENREISECFLERHSQEGEDLL